MCYTEMQRLATRNNVRIKSENSHLDYGVERVFIERGESAFLSVISPRAFPSNAPEYVSPIRGALLRGALGACGNPSCVRHSRAGGNPVLTGSMYHWASNEQRITYPVLSSCEH